MKKNVIQINGGIRINFYMKKKRYVSEEDYV